MIERAIKDSVLGYFIIEIEGVSLEKVFAVCREKGITLLEVKRASYTRITAKTDMLSYRKFKKYAIKNGFSVKAVKSGGLPVTLMRKRVRFVIIPAVCCIFALVVVFSFFIWDIEYTGFDRSEVFEVMSLAESMGLYEGAPISGVDKEEIVSAIRERFDDIAWVSISFYGTKAIVSGVTSDFSVDDIPSVSPEDYAVCDIVALKDGYITDMRVYAGTKVADNNMAVKKGDLLVSADIFFSDNEQPSYSVHSKADVFATVLYYGAASGPLFETVNVKTGSSYTEKYMELFGNMYLIGDEGKKYAQYTAEVSDVEIIGENMAFPVKIYDVTFYETKSEQHAADEKVLETMLSEQAYYDAVSQIPDTAEITDVRRETKKNDDILYSSVIIETTENISLSYYR